MKLSLILRETPEKVKYIWHKYHSDRRNTISFTFESQLYHQFIQNLKYCPLFVYPLTKGSGHFMLLSQAQQKSILFTTVEEFRQNPQNSNPYLILTLYDEL